MLKLFEAINVIESPELRDLLCFVGQGNLTDKDIPGRTELKKKITEAFQISYRKMAKEIQVSKSTIELNPANSYG